MKKLIILGLTSSFLFAGGISVSVKPVDNTIYEKVDFPHKYLNWRCRGYDKRTLFDPVLQLNG